jgi:lauroyl/myristoyl acyltransferase
MAARRKSPITWLMPLGTLVQFMLPRWFLLPLARLAGILACRFDHRRRAGATENCRHILGPDADSAE